MTSPARSVGRLIARLSGHGAAAQVPKHGTVTVPVTLRLHTADDEDVRLLLELEMEPVPAATEADLERLAYALVAPAVAGWVARHRLSELSADLGDQAVDDATRDVLRGHGAELPRVAVVAIEHLLVSPSAEPRTRLDGSW